MKFGSFIKKIASITLVTLILAGVIICTGCTAKTYKLVGLVDVENDKIVYYADLSDDDKKIIDELGSYTIKLGVRHDFVMELTKSYPQKEGVATISYVVRGTYEIKDSVISFTAINEENAEVKLPDQQYTNGRIIFYDNTNSNGVYLVFE